MLLIPPAVHGLFTRIVTYDLNPCERVFVRTDDTVPLLLAAAVIDGRKLVAPVECTITDRGDALGNDDLFKRGTIIKCTRR